jgi:hypothetical protein
MSEVDKANLLVRRQTCLGQSELVVQEMEQVAAKFKTTFRRPFPLYLSIHKLASGAVYLRWRRTGGKGKQNYIQPESKTGQHIFLALPDQTRKVCLAFYQSVIFLNYKHNLLFMERQKLEQFIRQVEWGERMMTGHDRLE